jgi:hypothetical protein
MLVTHQANVASLAEQARLELAGIARREAANIQEKLAAVESLAEVMRVETATALDTPYQPSPAMLASLAMSPTGAYHTTRDTGDAAVYYTGVVPIGSAEKAKAHQLLQLGRVLRAVKAANPVVMQPYVNTHDSLNIIYPYFDVLSQYTPKMDIPSYNFYYEADAKHNPARRVVWTDAYLDPAGQGWIVSAIGPVYRRDTLEAVVGIDVTIDTIVRSVLSLDIPWEGYGALVSSKGMVIALSRKGEKEWGLTELTTHDYQTAILKDTLKPDDFNLFKRAALAPLGQPVGSAPAGVAQVQFAGAKLVSWATVPSPGWKLVLIVPRDNVYSVVDQLRSRSTTIAWLMVGGLVLFYLVFFGLLYRRAQTESRKLTAPLQELNDVVRRIGEGRIRARGAGLSDRRAARVRAAHRRHGTRHGQHRPPHRVRGAAGARPRGATRDRRRGLRRGRLGLGHHHGTVTRSERWKAILGDGADVGRPVPVVLEERLHPADRERVMASFDRCLHAGTVFDEEFRLRRRRRALRVGAQRRTVRARRVGPAGPDGRCDRRHHRAPRRRGRTAAREGARGGRQSRQERIHGEHQPRDPHAAERRARHDRPAAAHVARRRAARVRRDGPGVRRASARSHQRDPGVLPDRRRARRDRGEARRAARVRDRRRQPAGAPGPAQGPRARDVDRTRGARPRDDRSAAGPADPGEPHRQCDQVHGNRPGDARPAGRRREAGVRRGHVLGRGHRHRHPRGEARVDLRGLQPGRQLDHPQVRRHRSRPHDLEPARAPDGRHHPRREPCRRRQRVQLLARVRAGTGGTRSAGQHECRCRRARRRVYRCAAACGCSSRRTTR